MDAVSSFLCSPGLAIRAPSTASKSTLPCSSCIRFLHPPTTSRSIFVERKPVPSAPPSSSSLPAAAAPPPADEDAAGTSKEKTPAVRVRFVLPKPCLFGQQFLLVGDDPNMGLWDPLKAIPLQWSDDHVWTAELDIPVGKPIQFKFLLRHLSGEVDWQPGPDRILQTWETSKTIVVTEDWESAENQKVTEEEPLAVPAVEEAAAAESNQRKITEEAIARESHQKITQEEPSTIPTEEAIVPEAKIDVEKKLTSHDGSLVLVPGLAPAAPVTGTASKSSKEEAMVTAGKATDALVTSDGAENCSASQLQGKERKPESPNRSLLEEENITSSGGNDSGKTSSYDRLLTEEKLHTEESYSQSTSDVDIRKSLLQFLLNLGF